MQETTSLMTCFILATDFLKPFLKVYEDNKVIETENFHLDVEIS